GSPAVGTLPLSITAFDVVGNSTASSGLTVAIDNLAPVLNASGQSITSPNGNSLAGTGQVLTIKFRITDTGGKSGTSTPIVTLVGPASASPHNAVALVGSSAAGAADT